MEVRRDCYGAELAPISESDGALYKSCSCEPQRIVGGCPICACEECHDTGLTTIRGMCGGVEMDCDDQPCWACEGISKQRASKSLAAQEKA